MLASPFPGHFPPVARSVIISSAENSAKKLSAECSIGAKNEYLLCYENRMAICSVLHKFR
jgi:hypothetical protein